MFQNEQNIFKCKITTKLI